MPLHPALVHLPIGLALVLGVVLAALAYLSRAETAPRSIWWLGAALAAIVAAGALAASSAGEDEALRLREVVPHAAIEAHDDAAGYFTATAIFVAVLSLVAGVAAKPRIRRILQITAAVWAFLLIPLALRTGYLGGELVWLHGAARGNGGATTVIVGVGQ